METMRARLGPYASWVGPYQVVNVLMAPFIWNKEKRDEHWMTEKISDVKWLRDLCNWVDTKKNRKIKIRIDRWDTWSADHTMSMIILPLLIELKKNKSGYSFVKNEDVPEHLRSNGTEENYDLGDGFTEEKWDWVLGEMIWAHQQIVDDSNGPKDMDEWKKYQARLSHGLLLFGKYYQSLWT